MAAAAAEIPPVEAPVAVSAKGHRNEAEEEERDPKQGCFHCRGARISKGTVLVGFNCRLSGPMVLVERPVCQRR